MDGYSWSYVYIIAFTTFFLRLWLSYQHNVRKESEKMQIPVHQQPAYGVSVDFLSPILQTGVQDQPNVITGLKRAGNGLCSLFSSRRSNASKRYFLLHDIELYKTIHYSEISVPAYNHDKFFICMTNIYLPVLLN